MPERIAHRILDRGKADRAPEPLRLPRPLNQLPWDIGQFEFGVKGTDFIGVLSTVLQRDTQSQFQVYLTDSASFPAHFPLPGAIPDGGCGTVRLCGARA